VTPRSDTPVRAVRRDCWYLCQLNSQEIVWLVPFDAGELRLERFNLELHYHAAYNFWNLRGVIAERWAHGPVFAGFQEQPSAQVTLLPATTEDDQNLLGIYGIRVSALLGEGPRRTAQAQDLASDWFRDVIQVLKPKLMNRMTIGLFGLYPVDDVADVVQRLRTRYYDDRRLRGLMPATLRQEEDTFHAAVECFVPISDEGSGVSIILGTVGPPHKGTFFAFEDNERDARWWLGLRYERRMVEPGGIVHAHRDLMAFMRGGLTEFRAIAEAGMAQVLNDA